MSWIEDTFNKVTNAASAALGTDGGGGGLLGGLSDLGKSVSDLVSSPLAKTAVEAFAIYMGLDAASLLPQSLTPEALSAAVSSGAVTADQAAELSTSVNASLGSASPLTGMDASTFAASGLGSQGATTSLTGAASNLGNIAMGGSSAATSAGAAGAASNAFGLSNTAIGAGSFLSGLAGMSNAGSNAQAAANAADPFASQRPQYQQLLSQFVNNPNATMLTMPGYQSGLQAVERADAAQGFAGGGRSATDIANYTGQFYNQQMSTLAQLAGANSGSPASAGSALQQGGTNQQTAFNNLVAGSLLLAKG